MKREPSPRHRAAALAVSAAAALAAAGCGGSPDDVLSYNLPPEQDDYRLTLDRENVHTEWEFSSRTVTNDETPPGRVCLERMFGADKPCRPEALIFLRYDAGVGLDNAVPSGRRDTIDVTAYKQVAGPRITGLQLWVSVDDGATWRQVRAQPRGGGSFRASVEYPRFERTTGAVSLKTRAWDAASNSVSQTLVRAFDLRRGDAVEE